MQHVYDYAGYNLHTCMICDGYEIALNWFTPYITVFTQGLCAVGSEMRHKLKEHGYPLVELPIQQFLGHNHEMSGVELADGSTVTLETGLVAMGSHYHNEYLQGIDLEQNGKSLVTDSMCCTSHPRIFALGDLKEGRAKSSFNCRCRWYISGKAIWRGIRRASPARRWEQNIQTITEPIGVVS